MNGDSDGWQGRVHVNDRLVLAIEQRHPHPGWAEQDPVEIWHSVQQATRQALEGLDPARVAAVGLSVQRESTVLWDRATGTPPGPLLGAGLGAGVWSTSDLDALPRPRSAYRPGPASGERDRRLQDWHTSVAAARDIANRSGGMQ